MSRLRVALTKLFAEQAQVRRLTRKTVRLRVPSQQHDAYLDLFSVQSYRLLETKVMIAGDAGRFYLVITGVV